MAVHVGGRIGLGIAERLRLRDRILERPALAHPAQQEIGGAVHHSLDRDHARPGPEPLQQFEHRYRAADRGGIGKVRARRLGRGMERVIMARHRRLVGGDDMGAAAQRAEHDVGRMIGAAKRFDDEIGLAGERLVEVGGEGGAAFAGVAVRVADQDRIDPEQVRPLLEIGEHAGADRAAAEQGDPERRPLHGHFLARRAGGDQCRLVMADRGDLDTDVLDRGGVDRLGLDQPGARLGGGLVAERAIAFGARILRRILGIDAVDVLEQPHPLRAEPRGEEDRGKIGAAPAERHHAMARHGRR